MKKLIIIATLFIALLMPVTSFADVNAIIEDDAKDWRLIEIIDDFTDKVSGVLTTANSCKFGHPAINIFYNKNKLYMLFQVSGEIQGKKITYRVDKNPGVTLTPSYYGTVLEGNYILHGKDCDTLIEDFKKGKTVIYKIHSDNVFIEDNQERVSLIGFTRLYNKLLKYEVK